LLAVRWCSSRPESVDVDEEIPAKTAESDTFSRDLTRRGFGFVGSTIIYAYMQAVGTVKDHLVDCFRYREVNRLGG
jgi:DNA-3-methyladenine glycosylase I